MKKIHFKKAAAIGLCCTILGAGSVWTMTRTSLANETRQSIEIDIENDLLKKQREIDEYVFETHIKEIEDAGFKVTNTGPRDGYVEIGILPYNEDNANYIYGIFGKENVKVVEGIQAVTLPLPNDAEIIGSNDYTVEEENIGVRIQMNGGVLELDVEPFIENSRTLIPLRGIMEKLGAEVEWYAEQETVKVHTDDILIELVIGETTVKVIKNKDGVSNEESIQLDVPAKIVNGRTFIPARFVTETLGAKVDWDEVSSTMIIETGSILEQEESADEKEVRNIVESFGLKLQMVSLQSPKDILEKSMQENYGDFVSQQLLERLISDPLNAPGRLLSSPWPDRIEILTIENTTDNEYKVDGEIIEITSTEKGSDGVAAKRLITLVVEKVDDSWLINDIILGDYNEVNDIVYKNTQYGFNFSLPDTWKGYEIVTDEWEGLAIGDLEGSKPVEKGPIINIRHPEWTSEKQRQDIPIMIFTLEQWDLLQDENFHIGAAPIGPRELGCNTKYVFALPARYNFAFPEGYEEVEDILEKEPLQPTESIE